MAGVLPFEQLRVRTSELARTPLPTGKVLVENEQCTHQLPRVDDVVAILGAGLNVSWLETPWLRDRQVAYWGDLDTWGLAMLGKARSCQPDLSALMMDRSTFNQFESRAVPEPVPFNNDEPEGLTSTELQLFKYLMSRERGRLEQEFLPKELVTGVVSNWSGRVE